jgi:3-methyl-2-oxobutanoate hydroxymethyltransferase
MSTQPSPGTNGGTPTTAPADKVTVGTIRARKGGANPGEKLVVLTAYDVTFARLADRAGVDVILVGDSLGMVFQGHGNTLPVTLDDMIYHARAVGRGVARAHMVVDLPFGSYQFSIEDGLRAGGRVLKETPAEAVKIEGGEEVAPLVAKLVAAGIPVMGHVGLTPQSLHQLGGFKVQGKTETGKAKILAGARALADAGAYSMVLEGMPAPLAAEVTAAVPIPTIGIGAGPGCDGQVLVMHDLLGLDPGWSPRFVRRYAELGKEIDRAFKAYADDVRAGKFPGDAESFK